MCAVEQAGALDGVNAAGDGAVGDAGDEVADVLISGEQGMAAW